MAAIERSKKDERIGQAISARAAQADSKAFARFIAE